LNPKELDAQGKFMLGGLKMSLLDLAILGPALREDVCLKTVKHLVQKYDLNINKKNLGGLTPYDVASMEGKHQVAAYLKREAAQRKSKSGGRGRGLGRGLPPRCK
jgi:hypothetical protein